MAPGTTSLASSLGVVHGPHGSPSVGTCDGISVAISSALFVSGCTRAAPHPWSSVRGSFRAGCEGRIPRACFRNCLIPFPRGYAEPPEPSVESFPPPGGTMQLHLPGPTSVDLGRLFGAWRLAAALFLAGCPRARCSPGKTSERDRRRCPPKCPSGPYSVLIRRGLGSRPTGDAPLMKRRYREGRALDLSTDRGDPRHGQRPRRRPRAQMAPFTSISRPVGYAAKR